KWKLKPETEWVLTAVEPIVTAELWARCNQILDEMRTTNKRPARRAVHLFTGLTFCACGTQMYVPSNMPKYYCKNCHNKIPIEDLEGVFQEQLRSFFFSPKEIA